MSQVRVAHHFDTLEQQHEAATLGMWMFLATEAMFFGGLFLGYVVMRYWYPAAFAHGSAELNVWLGAINTTVLLGSSLTMALAVHSARLGRRNALVLHLGLTMLLGTAFLVIKGFEWYHDYELGLIPTYHFAAERWLSQGVPPREVELFFTIYFAMTGLHAAHMIVGLGLLAALVVLGRRGRYTQGNYASVENMGLYWHFVDIVWIFLFPLFYLVGAAGAG